MTPKEREQKLHREIAELNNKLDKILELLGDKNAKKKSKSK